MLLLKSKLFMVVALGVIAVTFVGCPTRTRIADITKDPGRYAGKEVTVAGRASSSFGAMGNGIFQIDDGSGHIWVFSQSFGVPGDGSKVAVTGRIEQGISVAGRSFAVVLKETQRRH